MRYKHGQPLERKHEPIVLCPGKYSQTSKECSRGQQRLHLAPSRKAFPSGKVRRVARTHGGPEGGSSVNVPQGRSSICRECTQHCTGQACRLREELDIMIPSAIGKSSAWSQSSSTERPWRAQRIQAKTIVSCHGGTSYQQA